MRGRELAVLVGKEKLSLQLTIAEGAPGRGSAIAIVVELLPHPVWPRPGRHVAREVVAEGRDAPCAVDALSLRHDAADGIEDELVVSAAGACDRDDLAVAAPADLDCAGGDDRGIFICRRHIEGAQFTIVVVGAGEQTSSVPNGALDEGVSHGIEGPVVRELGRLHLQPVAMDTVDRVRGRDPARLCRGIREHGEAVGVGFELVSAVSARLEPALGVEGVLEDQPDGVFDPSHRLSPGGSQVEAARLVGDLDDVSGGLGDPHGIVPFVLELGRNAVG